MSKELELTDEERAVEKLAKDLEKPMTLRLLAEWIAIEHNETRLQSEKYLEEAQELDDWLYTIGYRLTKSLTDEQQPDLWHRIWDILHEIVEDPADCNELATNLDTLLSGRIQEAELKYRGMTTMPESLAIQAARKKIKRELEDRMGWQLGKWKQPDMLISFHWGRWQAYWKDKEIDNE